MKQKESTFDLDWSKPPVRGRWQTGKFLMWETTDGRYRVYRATREDGEPPYLACVATDNQEFMVECDRLKGAGYPLYRKTMKEAIDSILIHFRTKNGREAKSNHLDLNELSSVVSLNNSRPEAQERAMKLSRDDALALLKAVGSEVADKVSNSRLETKLSKIGNIPDEELEKIPDELKELLGAVLKAEEIVVEGGSEMKEEKTKKAATPAKSEKAEKNGKAEKSSKSEKGKPDKSSKPAKERKSEKELDRFGMRLGTRAAEINKVISKSPKSLSDILKEAGVKPPINSHMKKLIEKGYVVKTDKGYKAAK